MEGGLSQQPKMIQGPGGRPRVTADPLLLGAPPHEWPPAGNSRAIRSDVSLAGGEGIEAGGTRAGGAVGLPGVWRFLMSPVRRGPAGQARSWGAGGPWSESTLPARPGHHGLACPASRPCHGALPLATAPLPPSLCPAGEAAARAHAGTLRSLSERVGRPAGPGTVSCSDRSRREAACWPTVQTLQKLRAYRALLPNQHPAVRKPRPGRRALSLCFPGS